MDNSTTAPDNQARRWPRAELVAQVKLLAASDYLESIAQRMGIKPPSLEKALARAGETDLLARITLVSLHDQREEWWAA